MPTNPRGRKHPFVGDRQLEALRCIDEHIRSFHEPPTRSELGRRLNVSAVSAHLLIDKLQAAGLVARARGRHRNVWVTAKGSTELM